MSQSINWKLGTFGLIALMLILGLSAGSAVAAATGSVTSGGVVIAGSTGNTITIQISGATIGQDFSITPPAGWSDMGQTGVGETVVTSGATTVVFGNPARGITITPTATDVTIVYGTGGGGTGVTISTKVEVTSFEIKDPTTSTTPSTALVVASVDGSGNVQVNSSTTNLDELAGVTGRTFNFLYTAIGLAGGQNEDKLNGGALTLTIPVPWTAPTGSNIAVSGNPSGDPEVHSASVGSFSISGSGPWTITIPINDMDSTEEIEIQYKSVTVPSATGTYAFPMRVRGFGGILTPIQVAGTNSKSLEINVKVANRGSGTMIVSGGPVAAGSTGNTLTFIYAAEGTLDGGGLELVPPAGWTEPQGSPGSAGYTTVTFSSGASGTPAGFNQDKGDKKPDFTGKGINLLFTQMRVGDQVTIVYGANGGNSGATAPSTTGLSFFDVFVAPSFSDNAFPIGDAEGAAGDSKFADHKKPFVSVQAGGGSGSVVITDKSGNRETNAGEKETLTFTFTADGPMNGGQFTITVDNAWPFPTSGNTSVTSTGSVDATVFLQREIRVPIVFLSGTQTITVIYGKSGDEVSAPGIPQTTPFVFKSQSTPGGVLTQIPEPNGDEGKGHPDDDFVVKVNQAKDGAGRVTLLFPDGTRIPEAQRKVFAASGGNTFAIIYTAVGQMDGGEISLTTPVDWTVIKGNLSVGTSGGVSITDQAFSDSDRTVTYKIASLRENQTVTFTYSGVTVQPTKSTTDVPLEVKVSGADGGTLTVVSDTEAKVNVDNVADGKGTVTIGPKDVPANDTKNFVIKYKEIGQMDDGTVEVTVAATFTVPQNTSSSEPGFTTVSGGGNAALSIFGRQLTVTGVDLLKDGELTINYNDVSTPDSLGMHEFTTKSQGRPDTDSDTDDRSLKAVASSPLVTVGNVAGGKGEAKITLPAKATVGGVDDIHALIANSTGQTVTIVFEAVGPMDGGEVKIFAPAQWTKPGGTSGLNNPGEKGYVTVDPSSGASRGTLVFPTNQADTSFTIPIVTLRDGHTLTISYGAGGGSSGVDVPQTVGDHQFIVQTKMPGETVFTNIPDVGNRAEKKKKLFIQVTDIEGSGTIAVSPNAVIRGSTTTFTFLYTAAGNIGSLTISLPTDNNLGVSGWPNFQHPNSTTVAGRVSFTRGELVNPPSGGSSISVSLQNLNLKVGETVAITYTNVAVPPVVSPNTQAEWVFGVLSSTNPSGGGATVGSGAQIAVVSTNGSGKVAENSLEVSQDTDGGGNRVIEERRAGKKANLTFFYNLDTGDFIKNGEVEIIVPSPWSAPTTDTVDVTQINSSTGVDLGLGDDDKPIKSVSGRAIIIAIKQQQPGQSIKIVFKDAVASTARETSAFLVRSKSLITGFRAIIPKNRVNSTQDSKVVVTVVDGEGGTGSATSNIPGTVASGSNNNTFQFVYTASAELSTQTVPGVIPADFAGVGGIQIAFPDTWAVPNASDIDDNPTNSANVTVSSNGTLIDLDSDGNFDEELIFGTSGGQHTISVPIKKLLPGQSITLVYGAGKDQAEAQGNTTENVGFFIRSKGGETSDTFFSSDNSTVFPDGATPDDGKFEFDVGNATDGSGDAIATVTINQDGIPQPAVAAAGSGLEIKFEYTAVGRMNGGSVRLARPTGWISPQGLSGTGGFTTSPDIGTKVGLPTFDSTGVTFPIINLGPNEIVTIMYGSGGGNSGAVAPTAKAVGDNAPKFRIETKGASGGSLTLAEELAVNIVNANSGTGFAQISPSTTNAGKKDTYLVIYTAVGTLDDGAVRLEIPSGWAPKGFNKDDMPVSTSGKLNGDPTYDALNSRVTANIDELGPNQTVTFTLEDTVAQSNKQDDVVFRVDSSNAGTGNLQILNHTNDAEIDVTQAADGSGDVVLSDFKNVVKIGEEPGDLVFTYTLVGTMLDSGRVTLDIPNGWTAPVKDDEDSNDEAGEVRLSGSASRDAVVVTGRTVIAQLNGDASAGSTIVFTYKKSKAPSTPQASLFTVKSKSQILGSLVTAKDVVITVSPSGHGSGAMTISESSVPASKSGFDLTFTYTAAESITGGELRVTIPSSWGTAKDKIFDVSGATNKVTFRIQGGSDNDKQSSSLLDAADDKDDERTIIIPIASLSVRNQIVFKYTGTAQNTAGTATFTTMTKLTNAGTLIPIATQPQIAVTNVEKGKGTVTFTPETVASASSGNQLTFDFKAAGTMNGGSVSMEVPATWSEPQLTQGIEGFVTASTPSGGSVGAVSVSGLVVTVPIDTLGPDQIIRIIYGSGSGSSGAVAQDNAGGATFVFKTKGSSGDDFASILKPATITVTNAPDGSGTVSVAPTAVTAGSVQELLFTYKPAGTINGGKVQITVPSNWTSPQGASGRGFTTAETDPGAALGTLTFAGKSVIVPIAALTVGQTVRIKYGSGGGSNGVIVPPELGPVVFAAKSQGLTDQQGGQLIELISAPPVVTVGAAGDGSGTATVTAATAPVTAGSTGNTVTVIFIAAGPMTDGGVSLDVPTGWSPPEGLTTVSSTGTTGNVTFSGQTITVDGVNLSSNQTVTFTYANATAQGSAGSAVFGVKSRGTETGTLTTLESVSPDALTVAVSNAADGSGTMVANPATVVANSAINVDFTYKAVGTMNGGVIRLTVPSEWTAPQDANPAGAGFITVQTATGLVSTPQVSGRVVTIPITSLGAGGEIVITYKSAIAPSILGVSTFTAQSRSSGAGTSTALAESPSITTTVAASVLAISSAPQSVFKGQASGAITIATWDGDGNPAASASDVTVNLSSSSTTGAFDTSKTGAFDGTVTSVSIPAGQTSANVYYKDATAGTATLTATAPSFPAETQTATQDITVADTASQLALSSAGSFFAGDTLEVTVETQDASGNAAPSTADVTVTLSSSSAEGTFDPTSVTIPEGQTSATVSYMDTTVGTATLTAQATGLTAATREVTVDNTVKTITVSGSPVKAGDTVTITAIGKPGLTGTFSISDDIVTDKAMTEDAGTYTGDFSPVAGVHADGTYDVVVNIGSGSKTLDDGVTIDSTAPVLTDATADPARIKNGDSLTLSVKSTESGLTVEADVSDLDTTQTDPIPLTDADADGTYSATVTVSEDNTAGNGSRTVLITATDVAGNAATPSDVTVDLRNFAEFDLSIPKGIGLIHIPLAVTGVGDVSKELKTVGDVFDALGDDVNFLITYDPANAKWLSYLGDSSKGTAADQTLTDDMGLISVMKNAVTLRLKGDGLGTDGTSAINLKAGTNLTGVPLKDSRVNVVSDLLELDGIKDNAAAIIVSDAGEFKVVARAGDPGDIAITGGQSFIITASQDSTTEITGDAWDNVSGSVSAAPSVAISGLQVGESTPVLAIQGAVVDEITNAAKADFRVTVKNLSTGASVNAVASSEGDEGGYNMTFVDTKSGRAVQVGDVLEISVESPNPLIGVQPLRHIVSTDDVKDSQIQLEDLIAYEIPAETELLLNYPNPFNPETWIAYRLAEDASVTLTIYDMTGKVVRAIQVGFKPAAVYESKDKAIYWDGRNNFGERVASGIYFYNLSTGEFTATQKMVILK